MRSLSQMRYALATKLVTTQSQSQALGRLRGDVVRKRYSTKINGTRKRRWSEDRKSTRLNSSHLVISYAVFCLKKKKLRCKQNISSYAKTENYTREKSTC